jgi:hypothetical protein
MSEASPLLVVDDLSIEFRTRSGTVRALEKVGFDVGGGETVVLVGERLGEIGHCLCAARPARPGGAGHVGPDPIRRNGVA